MTDEQWMNEALDLARRAGQAGEVPVGAVLVRDECVIGVGRNQPIGATDPSAHAEIGALRDAAARTGNYRLPGATLYTTLEPCAMCAGAIIQARLARVVFGALDERAGAVQSVFSVLSEPRLNHRVAVEAGVGADASRHLLRSFFRARRSGVSCSQFDDCERSVADEMSS
ncbi:tRNA adenosine(34) deaminase TadA [Salinisphaera sp. USBA-960]|uniref:tRNA adenosine(34) deaminase TadA n=1 Tax=Salinisphaera orenii TaxID=856731 RepID=UPI000DBE3C06|nr:tRNA adenosine(34) deaminase TadA [Salifodinibacter halophilus]NNC26197.1 tRNA adenosine(34) deaminase TadA [Salifodinibacter halophilus]